MRHRHTQRVRPPLLCTRVVELLAVLRSLRWLLTGLLLLQTGLPPDELAARFKVHQPYVLFRRQAREWLPDVFQDH